MKSSVHDLRCELQASQVQVPAHGPGPQWTSGVKLAGPCILSLNVRASKT